MTWSEPWGTKHPLLGAKYPLWVHNIPFWVQNIPFWAQGVKGAVAEGSPPSPRAA